MILKAFGEFGEPIKQVQKLDVVQLQHQILCGQTLHWRRPRPLGEKCQLTEMFSRADNAHRDAGNHDSELPVEHEIHLCVSALERVTLPHDELLLAEASSVLYIHLTWL